MYSRPRAQFFSIRTDPKPVNNIFIFFRAANVKKLQAKYTRADRLRDEMSDVCRKFIFTVHRFHQFEKVEWNKLV